MGVEGTKATGYGNSNAKPRGAKGAEFLARMEPPDEVVGTAVGVIVALLRERHDENPSRPIAKISLAVVPQGDWCCSANDWGDRVGLSGFAPTPGAAICSLAAKLVNGEPWKKLPDRET